jgi:hypothetical protein
MEQRCSSIQSESRAVDVSVQLRTTTALTPRKELRYPLNRRVVGQLSRCERFGLDINLLPLAGIRTTFPRNSRAEPHHDNLHAVPAIIK